MADYKFEWHGEKVLSKVDKAIRTALLTAGADLQRKSAKQAPKEYGDLEADCKVSDIKNEGNRFYVTVGYSLPYAIKQHEDLTLRHPNPRSKLSVPGRKAKYLEDPYKENVNKYEKLIANAIHEEIGD
ncbi:HK97 gp10 family phage protein [Carboxydothermus hydrogenoformans]|uniref:Uncharacterized protein n=1 Tax=Carboxydothermus hydrogenoformans (strain ATCC BAA-161 / DSM 6008 / Z-2901) TaxID=246194 RepID=Q3ABJ7_CARHZ|nr:HK97 gp10 family phage protein [Carboxydothermus hydrogenoformans]ABB15996.1 hypothetical protein CHY_1667 [Carboxydothermus hydrogenoformans Z-2901]